LRIELRGTISAALGARAFELELPETGLPLGRLLETLVAAHPRASRYLGGKPDPTMRIVLNGSMLEPGESPTIHEGDSLLLIQAVAGGQSE
jgi:molybdopterin converting factor small subunit